MGGGVVSDANQPATVEPQINQKSAILTAKALSPAKIGFKGGGERRGWLGCGT
jgi:hypothetical protein